MFEFTVLKDGLRVTLPQVLEFNMEFHLSMTELIWYIETLRAFDRIDQLIIHNESNSVFDKMCYAYIYNVLDYYAHQIRLRVLVNRRFKEILKAQVKKQQGDSYSNINFSDLVTSDDSLKYYVFKGDKYTDRPVENIVDIISKLSLSLNTRELRDFLITTIGEVFSNSTNHSEQDEMLLMFNVEKKDRNYYLTVNIIDYGTTIVTNVRRYMKSSHPNLNGVECIEWAVKKGNTTRRGSGGYGLSTLIDYIKAAKGFLFILSGDAYYSLTPNGREVVSSTYKEMFCGTSVTFKVKLFDMDNILTCKSGLVGATNLDALNLAILK